MGDVNWFLFSIDRDQLFLCIHKRCDLLNNHVPLVGICWLESLHVFIYKSLKLGYEMSDIVIVVQEEAYNDESGVVTHLLDHKCRARIAVTW